LQPSAHEGARSQHQNSQFLRENVIDLNEAAGLEFGRQKGTDWDREEMKLFTFIIASSIFPALLVRAIG
jgi:hypothetical protein